MLATALPLRAGWSFDTGITPEKAAALLAAQDSPAAPAGSWLRLRGLDRSAVLGADGTEAPAWPGLKPDATVATRRAALAALRAKGYRFVAILEWPSISWSGGVRMDQPLRRLPVDLREAFERCRLLAQTYGDLVDYWEIQNEPDISFVEENPETYAAFLKACYLGLQRDFAEADDRRPTTDISHSSSAVRPPPSVLRRSLVLMAPFALPPGPYFDAWVANDGLRYTEGFNYHYYGYPEDFTGVNQLFAAAVAGARNPAAAGEAVLATRFYATTQGWGARTLSRFDPAEGDTTARRDALLGRPRATGEPALVPQGRWLVSPGTTVEETAEGWTFTVASPAPGERRPAMAELPLPSGWRLPPDAFLFFEFQTDLSQATGPGKPPEPVTRESPPVTYPVAEATLPPDPQPLTPNGSARALPVFLTEYGYGLLGKEARWTAAGRETQQRWFELVRRQVIALGVEGAMAFLLVPYLEVDRQEFGLLIDTASAPSGSEVGALGGERLGDYTMSPALRDLLAAEPVPGDQARQVWRVNSPPPTPIVIDFVAGPDLTMIKTRLAYNLTSPQGTGSLILYNFSSQPIAGELQLTDGVWSLPDGAHTTILFLDPGERREISLTIHPAALDRFVPQPAVARFKQRSDLSRPPPVARPPSAEDSRPASAAPLPPIAARADSQPSPPSGPTADFEVYFRTASGNLYHAWLTLKAYEAWSWHTEPVSAFTPTFFGRAHRPAALADNEPAALVFFFRPPGYPAIFRIRRASLLEYRLRD